MPTKKNINVNKPSTAAELEQAAREMRLQIQVFARDNIPIDFSGRAIINLNASYEPGSHWVALYLPSDPKASGYFYDSFGVPPLRWIDKMTKHRKLHWNDRPIQAMDSEACGWYCLQFLITVDRALSESTSTTLPAVELDVLERVKHMLRTYATGNENRRMRNNEMLALKLSEFSRQKFISQ